MNNVSATSRRNIKYVYRFFCSLWLVFMSTFSFYFTWIQMVQTRNESGYLLGLGNQGMAVGIYILLYSFVSDKMRAFKIGVERTSNILAAQIMAILATDAIEVIVSCAITNQFRYFWDFTWAYFLLFLQQVAVNCILLVPMILFYRRTFPPLHIVEVYGIHKENHLCERMNSLIYKYNVEDRISVLDGEDVIREKIRDYDAVLLNDIHAHKRNRILKLCFEMNKRVYYLPKISDVFIKNAEELNLIDAPIFMNRNNGMSVSQRVIKRTMDIVLSLIALIVLSPVMLITALLIYLEDGGPVFFKQERVTIGGKRFIIVKFRSMIVDAEKDGRPNPAGEKDDRITRIGHFIRATRIDELPQLFNILAGDMSIVGPRPERWEHVEKYAQDIPEFVYRNKMKGGLTGYAQVYGKYNTSALDKLKLDLLYITNYSVKLDLQIIIETVKILFNRESTEGFTPEASSRMRDAGTEGKGFDGEDDN